MRQRLILSIFSLLLVLGLAPNFAQAQAQGSQNGVPSDGREFWLGYIRGTDRIYWGQYNGYFALVSSYTDNVITVNYFDEGGKEIQGQTYRIPKMGSMKIPLDRGKMRGSLTGEDVAYRSARIKAKNAASVYFYSEGSFNGALYQSFPTPALGKKYVVASHFDSPAANGTWSGDSASSTFLIIAPFDNTNVTITPNATTMSGRTGMNSGKGATGVPKPYTIKMMRGQTYQVLSPPIDREHDMSGSTIEASKPVAVISGHQRAMIGDPGELANNLDADYRDMAIEQMIPVESWAKEGYISIPFYEVPWTSSMYEGGKGDLYRFYTDESSDQVDLFEGGINSPYTYQIGRYAYTNPERDNVQQPVNVKSVFGKKINVVQYDLFQGELHGSWATGYMSPGMTNVIPESRWRRNYMWFVPSDSRLKGGQYINVIGPTAQIDKIEVILNAAAPKPLSAFPRLKTFTIPQRPDLRGYQIKVGPGTYIMQSPEKFMVYVYGFENGGYKDNYGYVSTAGSSFGSGDEANMPKMNITPNCSSWDLVLTDSSADDQGLAQVELLDDPNGFVTRPAYVSKNVRMNPTEPQFEPGAKTLPFSIQVLNPFKDAYAAVWVVDKAGNDTVYQFTYRAPSFTATPDSIDFGAIAVGSEKCSTFTFTNTALPGGQPVRIEDIRLLINDPDIQITKISRPIPTNLLGGESITVDVCFKALDAPNLHFDSLLLKTDCFEASLAIMGSGLAPSIMAYDVDFGTVSVGGKRCLPVKVENIGTAQFTLTKDYFLHNSTEFEFADFDKLPLVLKPGQWVELQFCYKPTKISDKDSTTNDWGTDMPAAFKGQKKAWSYLIGNAVAPEVVWTQDIQYFDAQCAVADTERVYLTNILTSNETLQDIEVYGPDAAEFKVIRLENGWTLPLDPSRPISPEEEIYVDVVFTPDLSRGYGTRRANLRAVTMIGIDDTIQLAAHVFYADLKTTTTDLDFGRKVNGGTVRKTLRLTNPGTADLIVKTVSVSNPAFRVLSGVAVGDTIFVNGYTDVEIEGIAPENGVITGELIINGETPCPPQVAVPMKIAGYFPTAEVTGFPAPITFVCRDTPGEVTFRNLDVPLRLDMVEIVAGPNSGHYQFADGSQMLTVGKVLAPFEIERIPVVFRPTSVIVGDGMATVRFTYTDTVSKGSYTLDESLTGSSEVLTNVLSVEKDDKTVYTADPMERFSIDVKMLDNMIPRSNIGKVRFGIAFRQDLFRFESFDAGVGLSNTPPSFSGTNDLMDTAWIDVTGDIEGQDILGSAQFTLLVSRDLESPFTIVEPKMYDVNGEEACYVTVADIPASFIPREWCGTQVLRDHLNGILPTSVSSITPNPAKDVITLTYDVNVSDVPVTIEVYDVLGNKVASVMQGKSHSTGRYVETIDATMLPTGNYTVRIAGADRVSTHKVMIKH